MIYIQVFYETNTGKTLSYQWSTFDEDKINKEEIQSAKDFITQELPQTQFNHNKYMELREYYIYELLLDKYNEDELLPPKIQRLFI